MRYNEKIPAGSDIMNRCFYFENKIRRLYVLWQMSSKQKKEIFPYQIGLEIEILSNIYQYEKKYIILILIVA